VGGELIHAARRKSRDDESNRRVSRPRQRRVRTIKARNVVSRLTLLVLPVNLNPEIGNSEWRSSWFSSRHGLIRFAGKHISLSLCHCTTYNENSCRNRCGADLVWVIWPRVSRSKADCLTRCLTVWVLKCQSSTHSVQFPCDLTTYVYHQYNTLCRLFLMQDLHQV